MSKLSEVIENQKAIIQKLEREITELQHECYFGAMIAFLVGVALGITAGVASVWL